MALIQILGSECIVLSITHQHQDVVGVGERVGLIWARLGMGVCGLGEDMEMGMGMGMSMEADV